MRTSDAVLQAPNALMMKAEEQLDNEAVNRYIWFCQEERPPTFMKGHWLVSEVLRGACRDANQCYAWHPLRARRSQLKR